MKFDGVGFIQEQRCLPWVISTFPRVVYGNDITIIGKCQKRNSVSDISWEKVWFDVFQGQYAGSLYEYVKEYLTNP